jgi:hypothetical protein
MSPRQGRVEPVALYTKVEQTLIEAGRLDHVRDTRLLHQFRIGAGGESGLRRPAAVVTEARNEACY